MFEELVSLTSVRMTSFAGTINDSFGQSIIDDVFTPMLANLTALQHMSASSCEQGAAIDRISAEVRTIGSKGNEILNAGQ